jgi:hypothetical protein
MHSDPNDTSEEDVKLMELSWNAREQPFPNVVGRRVLLGGGLFHGWSGHHHARVLLIVRSVALLDRTGP